MTGIEIKEFIEILVIEQLGVQYGKYFLSFSYFCNLFQEPLAFNIQKYEKREKHAILF